MRSPLPTLVFLGLVLAAVASAHGDTPMLRLTDKGCSLTDPPCIMADNGATVEAGPNTIVFQNDLDATNQVMIHLDAQGTPGAMIAGARPVSSGAAVSITFEVPADATGVWYMTLQDGTETARLFGGFSAGHGEPASADSPGLTAPLLLGLLALVGIASRRS